jgi:hypothetical protein
MDQQAAEQASRSVATDDCCYLQGVTKLFPSGASSGRNFTRRPLRRALNGMAPEGSRSTDNASGYDSHRLRLNTSGESSNVSVPA